MSDPRQQEDHSGIARVASVRVRPLRQAVLRPHQPPEACVYPGDDHPSTGHFAMSLEGVIVGVASVFRQAPEPDDPGAWRIRGMATAPEVRGRGHGAALLRACLDHARAHGGTRVWCNARSTAAGFYRRMGFREEGPEFDLPGIGAHFLMATEV
jgi:ribosomal protein S18 acetylase RimI-like enzyme